MEANTKYEQRGVSAAKTDVKNAIDGLDKGLFDNSFCKIIPDVMGDNKKSVFGPSYCNIMHADGAGTKAVLAYLYWKETGDLSVWRGIAQDAVVMNTDDLLCVGATSNLILSSTIGRNKFLIPGEVLKAIIEGTQEFVDKMAQNHINITFAGGETADLGDSVRTIVVDSTVCARMKKSEVIACNRIQAGDVIIGLASFGKTTYEDEYNSGIGSNGLTSARHDVLKHEYAEKYPETFDPAVDKSLIYGGSKSLTDETGIEGLNVGKLLLSPTRSYAPVIKAILENYRPSIHGIIHCTGGAQTKVMNFVKNLHVVKNSLFSTPPVFSMIQAESGTSWQEMYQVFNMGHRMELYVKENIASDLIKIARYFDLEAKVIGYCENSSRNMLTIEGEYGSFTY
ncbi:MAG: phosphoribosylformylglycinamidine cyclo-ligase [Lentimicrobiaceae bacterium]|nr:phosphoribosylformylglycinamidine cyclo-ligase [Lentimicrobiaceae bacterium]